MTNAQLIAKLNDESRQAMGIKCKVIQTEGISALSTEAQSTIRERVETFDDFTPDNDPYGEHDFGSFEQDGEKVLWKIDYFDKKLEYGSQDPTNLAITTRVLTIMLANEY